MNYSKNACTRERKVNEFLAGERSGKERCHSLTTPSPPPNAKEAKEQDEAIYARCPASMTEGVRMKYEEVMKALGQGARWNADWIVRALVPLLRRNLLPAAERAQAVRALTGIAFVEDGFKGVDVPSRILAQNYLLSLAVEGLLDWEEERRFVSGLLREANAKRKSIDMFCVDRMEKQDLIPRLPIGPNRIYPDCVHSDEAAILALVMLAECRRLTHDEAGEVASRLITKVHVLAPMSVILEKDGEHDRSVHYRNMLQWIVDGLGAIALDTPLSDERRQEIGRTIVSKVLYVHGYLQGRWEDKRLQYAGRLAQANTKGANAADDTDDNTPMPIHEDEMSLSWGEKEVYALFAKAIADFIRCEVGGNCNEKGAKTYILAPEDEKRALAVFNDWVAWWTTAPDRLSFMLRGGDAVWRGEHDYAFITDMMKLALHTTTMYCLRQWSQGRQDTEEGNNAGDSGAEDSSAEDSDVTAQLCQAHAERLWGILESSIVEDDKDGIFKFVSATARISHVLGDDFAGYAGSVGYANTLDERTRTDDDSDDDDGIAGTFSASTSFVNNLRIVAEELYDTAVESLMLLAEGGFLDREGRRTLVEWLCRDIEWYIREITRPKAEDEEEIVGLNLSMLRADVETMTQFAVKGELTDEERGRFVRALEALRGKCCVTNVVLHALIELHRHGRLTAEEARDLKLYLSHNFAVGEDGYDDEEAVRYLTTLIYTGGLEEDEETKKWREVAITRLLDGLHPDNGWISLKYEGRALIHALGQLAAWGKLNAEQIITLADRLEYLTYPHQYNHIANVAKQALFELAVSEKLPEEKRDTAIRLYAETLEEATDKDDEGGDWVGVILRKIAQRWKEDPTQAREDLERLGIL